MAAKKKDDEKPRGRPEVKPPMPVARGKRESTIPFKHEDDKKPKRKGTDR